MKFKVDHDLHIHSNISSCSHGEEQIPERMLRYAKENGFRKICLTDHFWDREAGRTDPWYEDQDFEHIRLRQNPCRSLMRSSFCSVVKRSLVTI